MIWHNGFTFDYKALLAAMGIRLEPSPIRTPSAQRRARRTPGSPGNSSPACGREARRERALAGQDILKTGMKNAGWSWTSVPMDGDATACWTSSSASGLGGMGGPPGVREHLEIATAMQTNAMAIGGLMADGRYLRETITEYQQKERALVEQAQARGWPSLSTTMASAGSCWSPACWTSCTWTPGGDILMDAEQMLNASSRTVASCWTTAIPQVPQRLPGEDLPAGRQPGAPVPDPTSGPWKPAPAACRCRTLP